jgi:hypothetical protein
MRAQLAHLRGVRKAGGGRAGGDAQRRKKLLFLKKKKQKDFRLLGFVFVFAARRAVLVGYASLHPPYEFRDVAGCVSTFTKVFGFFFAKKKALLAYSKTGPNTASTPNSPGRAPLGNSRVTWPFLRPGRASALP